MSIYENNRPHLLGTQDSDYFFEDGAGWLALSFQLCQGLLQEWKFPLQTLQKHEFIWLAQLSSWIEHFWLKNIYIQILTLSSVASDSNPLSFLSTSARTSWKKKKYDMLYEKKIIKNRFLKFLKKIFSGFAMQKSLWCQCCYEINYLANAN